MKIKNIKVSNFKSFKDIDIELGNLNVVIGANASGKSNFISFFRFLKDFSTDGLENAFSMQGGIEYLSNLKLEQDNEIKINFSLEFEPKALVKLNKNHIIKILSEEYSFIVKKSKEKWLGTKTEILLQRYKIYKYLEKENIIGDLIKDGHLTFSTLNDKIEIYPDDPDNIYYEYIRNFFVTNAQKNWTSYSLNHDFFLNLYNLLIGLEMLKYIAFYDFIPKELKKIAQSAGRIQLSEDGSNIVLVLRNLLNYPEKKRKFLNLMQSILPFIQDLQVQKHFNDSLILNYKEEYSEKNLPSFLLSDGTIHLTALIIALYFENNDIIILEEPDRYIHPYLISELVDMLKDASRNKQIIITTHNPEILKHVDLENILFINRDKDGFSVISKLTENMDVQRFLACDLGIDEQFAQNFLR